MAYEIRQRVMAGARLSYLSRIYVSAGWSDTLL